MMHGTTNALLLLMNDLVFAMVAIVIALGALIAVWSRWRRQMGGGMGPQEFSDGSMSTGPTGYPEEMHGHGKKIGPTDNNAANM